MVGCLFGTDFAADGFDAAGVEDIIQLFFRFPCGESGFPRGIGRVKGQFLHECLQFICSGECVEISSH